MGKTQKNAMKTISYIPTVIAVSWSDFLVHHASLQKQLRVFENAALGFYYMIMKVTVQL